MNRTAAVITVSDMGYRGRREDESGPALCALLRENGYSILHTALVPDEAEQIQAALRKCADQLGAALILTTGGTGFSPRDVTPEATLAVLERLTPGIPEVMRAVSLQITPRGCLSRSMAGIRGRSLIVNLPGSPRAAKENLLAVLDPIRHGLQMLQSEGSADCAADAALRGKAMPSLDAWLREAKRQPNAAQIGMYLTHNGVVRATARAQVRDAADAPPVGGMYFSSDPAAVQQAVEAAYRFAGIYYVRVWLNEGQLSVGDDLMLVLVGGDTRPHTVDALQALVERLKTQCVTETEQYAQP